MHVAQILVANSDRFCPQEMVERFEKVLDDAGVSCRRGLNQGRFAWQDEAGLSDLQQSGGRAWLISDVRAR